MLHFQPSLLKLTAGCAICLFFPTGMGRAAMESFNNTSILGDTANSLDFTLPDFNTSLGTLQDVELTLVVANQTQVRVFNATTSPLSFTNASVTSPISLMGPDNLKLGTSVTSTTASGTAAVGVNSFPGSTDTETKSETIAPTDFSYWQNQVNNAVSFTFSRGANSYGGTGPNGLYFGGDPKQTETATVAYTYLVAAPEPAEKYLVVIVAMAMALLVANRKRLCS